jgi:pilus assembly protein TadC
MLYLTRKYVYAVWAASAAVAVFIIGSIILSEPSAIISELRIPLEPRINNTLSLALLLAILPPAVVYYINRRYTTAVADNIPRFLRGVMDDINAGLPFSRALEEASTRDYGPISAELKVALSKFLMGRTMESALREMGIRLRHPQGIQVTTVLIEAYLAGGKVRDVLNTAVDVYSTFKEYRELRKTNVRPYGILVDLAVFVFLVISYVAVSQFLAPLQGAETSGFLAGILPLEYYGSILFWGSILESLFGGIIGGKISSGTGTAGLVHSVVLMSITIVFFNLMIFQQVIML